MMYSTDVQGPVCIANVNYYFQYAKITHTLEILFVQNGVQKDRAIQLIKSRRRWPQNPLARRLSSQYIMQGD
jgi:hypothetical protein